MHSFSEKDRNTLTFIIGSLHQLLYNLDDIHTIIRFMEQLGRRLNCPFDQLLHHFSILHWSSSLWLWLPAVNLQHKICQCSSLLLAEKKQKWKPEHRQRSGSEDAPRSSPNLELRSVWHSRPERRQLTLSSYSLILANLLLFCCQK